MARGFVIFMRGINITRGIGRVLLKVEPVLGPEIARAELAGNPDPGMNSSGSASLSTGTVRYCCRTVTPTG